MTNTPDGPLLRACEEFFALNKTWVEAKPESIEGDSVGIDEENHHQLTIRRLKTLQEMSDLSAATKQGVSAKQKVMKELLRLEESESPNLLRFVLALLEDYQNFFIRQETHGHAIIEPTRVKSDGGNSQERNRSRRFRLHNILGFFHN